MGASQHIRRRGPGQLAQVLLALLAGALPHEALAATQPARVLAPEVAAQLERAFPESGAIELRDARIGRDRVDGVWCTRPQGACGHASLTAPSPQCAGQQLPAWCVAFADGPDSLRREVTGRLATMPASTWSEPEAANPLAAAKPADRPAMVLAWSTLLLWFAGPLATGWLLGRLWRRLRGRAQGARPVVVTVGAAALASGVALVCAPQLGAWDAVATAALAAASGLGTAHAALADRRRLVLLVGSTTLALVALELAVRASGQPIPGAGAPRRTLLITGLERREFQDTTYAALFGPLAEPPLRLQRPAPNRPWLLHLGDSMVFGHGVQAEESLPAQLNRLQPGVSHINAGIPAVSLDVQFAYLQRILAAWPAPRAVVLHTFAGNDLLNELDLAQDACEGRPLLAPPGQPVRVTCHAPSPLSPVQRLMRSPPPLPLGYLAHVSAATRLLVVAWNRLAGRAVDPPTPAQAALRYAEIFQALRADLQARGIGLIVVLQPLRWDAMVHDAAADRAALLALVRDAGVAVIDCQPAFDAWVASAGADAYFLPANVHLNRRGVREQAELLAPQLAPLLAPLVAPQLRQPLVGPAVQPGAAVTPSAMPVP